MIKNKYLKLFNIFSMNGLTDMHHGDTSNERT